MTTYQAKKLVKGKLQEMACEYTRLSAKKVDFSDLALDGCIFVTVHGWKPNPAWSELGQFARQHGFCVQV